MTRNKSIPPTPENIARAFAYMTRVGECVFTGNKVVKLVTPGYVTVVSPDDYGKVTQFRWAALKHPGGKTYARRTVYVPTGPNKTIYLHVHLLNGESAGKDVDHIDGDGLNNSRANLRVATRGQNSANRGATRSNKSGHKGVSWHAPRKKWRASIKVDRVFMHLGLFTNREEAARAYDHAARHHFGEFARLNFPDQSC